MDTMRLEFRSLRFQERNSTSVLTIKFLSRNQQVMSPSLIITTGKKINCYRSEQT